MIDGRESATKVRARVRPRTFQFVCVHRLIPDAYSRITLLPSWSSSRKYTRSSDIFVVRSAGRTSITISFINLARQRPFFSITVSSYLKTCFKFLNELVHSSFTSCYPISRTLVWSIIFQSKIKSCGISIILYNYREDIGDIHQWLINEKKKITKCFNVIYLR